MKWLVLLLAMLGLSVQTAHADTEDHYAAISRLYAASEMWDAKGMWKTIPPKGGTHPITTLTNSVAKFGAAVLALMLVLQGITILKRGDDPSRAIVILLVEVGIIGVLMIPSVYAQFVDLFIYYPLHYATQTILDQFSVQITLDYMKNLTETSGEAASDDSWFSMPALTNSVVGILTSLFLLIAQSICWIISFLQGIYFALWYVLGPMLIPCFIYEPLRDVSSKWLASMLGAMMMGLIGSVLCALIFSSKLMSNAAQFMAVKDGITSIVLSLIIIVTMLSIPKLSSSITGGIYASASGALAKGMMAAGIGFKAGALGAGAGMAAGGAATKSAGMMAGGLSGMKAAGEAAGQSSALAGGDSFRGDWSKALNGFATGAASASLGSGAGSGIYGAGSKMSSMGGRVASLAAPNVSKAFGGSGQTPSRGGSAKPSSHQNNPKPKSPEASNLPVDQQKALGRYVDTSKGRQYLNGKDHIPSQEAGGKVYPDSGFNKSPAQQQMDMREIGKQVNGGKYKDRVDRVQLPKDYRVQPKAGQSYAGAAWGAMKSQMQAKGLLDYRNQNAISKRKNA